MSYRMAETDEQKWTELAEANPRWAAKQIMSLLRRALFAEERVAKLLAEREKQTGLFKA